MKPPGFLKVLAARPGLSISLAVALAAFAASLACDLSWSSRTIGAIDLGLAVYLVAAFRVMMRPTTPKDMAARAERVDEGRHAVLVLGLAVALLAIVSVMLEIPLAKSEKGSAQALRLAFVGATVILSWMFVHTSFALHYTHEFYGADDDEAQDKGSPGRRGDQRRGGLIFPGKDRTPDYWDFLHFAYVIGVANQTADVQIESKAIRRLVTVQGIVAFLFNTVILALSINLASSLL